MDEPTAKSGPLKLKLMTSVPGVSSSSNAPQTAFSNAAPGSSTPQTPLVTPGGSKLKFMMPSKSKPASPAPAPPKKTKAGRRPKMSAKLAASQTPIKEESDDEIEDTISVQAPPKKKIKLQLSATPSTSKAPVLKTPALHIKAKVKGKPPKRQLGEGYDSEASDREIDPAIEEEFVLRMMPGEDCEYLRQAIADKKIGIGKNNGGADVSMKFLDGDGRRAAITVRKNVYAATLVDLPCIIEGMKSWDKRGWWKSADICQMLWVYARIAKEEEAKSIALPSIIDPQTYQYPHGLTAPMHYARKRRFRKRLSKTAIEAVEDAVEKLLAADALAEDTRFEIIDPDRYGSQAFSPDGSSPPGYQDGEECSQDEDAEGEDDDQGYFPHMPANGVLHTSAGLEDAELEADLEAEMARAMEDEELAAATPASTLDATPSMATGGTPAAQEEDSGDESIEDEDDEDDENAASEIDEEEQNKLNQIQGTREDIIELERQLLAQQNSLATQVNPILRRRLEDGIRKIKNEIQLKKSSIGEGEEDE